MTVRAVAVWRRAGELARNATVGAEHWVCGRRRAVGLAVGLCAVVVAAAVAGYARHRTSADPADMVTRARLSTVASGLAHDFGATAPLVDDGIVRRFSGSRDGVLSGTVAARSETGRCFGFTVTVGRAWLVDGDPAGVQVGPLRAAPDSWCASPDPSVRATLTPATRARNAP